MTLTYRNGVFIASLIIYTPALIASLLLCTRHGFFTGLEGFRPLVIFVLARIIGACFELATITQPDNVSLYIGSFVVLTIAISPLEWTALGLLNRTLTSVRARQGTWIKPRYVVGVGLLILLGLILSIVGGVYSGDNYADTGVYAADAYLKASIIIWMVTYVAILAIAITTLTSLRSLPSTEKRVLAAVLVSLPLLLVRLVYSAIGIFEDFSSFNSVTGNTTILLCMALIEEGLIVYLFIGVGLTLEKKPKGSDGFEEHDASAEMASAATKP